MIPAKSGIFFKKMHPRKLDGFLRLIEGNWVNNLAFEIALASRFFGASFENPNSLCSKLMSESRIITIFKQISKLQIWEFRLRQ